MKVEWQSQLLRIYWKIILIEQTGKEQILVVFLHIIFLLSQLHFISKKAESQAKYLDNMTHWLYGNTDSNPSPLGYFRMFMEAHGFGVAVKLLFEMLTLQSRGPCSSLGSTHHPSSLRLCVLAGRRQQVITQILESLPPTVGTNWGPGFLLLPDPPQGVSSTWGMNYQVEDLSLHLSTLQVR